VKALRLPLLLVAIITAIPLFAAAPAADVTVPIVGYLDLPNDLIYRTELVLTNHRDTQQYVVLSLVQEGFDQDFRAFLMEPGETKLFTDSSFGRAPQRENFVAALHVRATLLPPPPGDDPPIYTPDPEGQLEASAFILAERGVTGSKGASRQEMHGIPANEYTIEDAVFLGARHSYGTGYYTNVGIVNLDPTRTETFYVEYQYQAPVAVVVPPLSLRQIRVPGEGAGGRWVRVYPEWSIGNGPPPRTTPWVAYASSVNTITGDAFTPVRVPTPQKFAIQ
jgi:hypothetical protein